MHVGVKKTQFAIVGFGDERRWAAFRNWQRQVNAFLPRACRNESRPTSTLILAQ